MTEQGNPTADPFSSAPHSVRFGRWIFKKRDVTPVPLLLFAAFLAMPTPGTIAAGLVMMLAGECMRIWGISYIGGISRTRSDGTGRLILSGPFGRTRNPLYTGNFLLSTGAVVLTGLWWFVPVFLVLFALQYQFIVYYEEYNLRKKFGAAYDEYARRVPRWLPIGPGGIDAQNPVDPSIKRALRSERNTFVAIVCTAGIFLCKFVFLPHRTVWAALCGLAGF